jgi:hypothetical protein
MRILMFIKKSKKKMENEIMEVKMEKKKKRK